MEIYGYIRVSTSEQNEDRQLIAMEECNIPMKNIYLDKQSGKDFNRPNYLRMMRKIKSGDIMYIKSIDRLGRNYEEIQNQLTNIKIKYKITERINTMKKFISILLALSLICCVPIVLAEGGGLDSGETSVTEYCGTCNSYTSCEVCTDYEYTYRNYDEHWVTYYEAVICTSCNSRLSSSPYYETSESHSYDDYGICSGCGATWDR